MEVGSYRHESDDTSELFDDFAALPDQFRPKKSFRTEPKNPTVIPKISIRNENSSNLKKSFRTEPKNPTVIPKISIRNENSSNLKNATCSVVGSLGKPSDKSPSVSKSVIEKNGKNILLGNSTTLPQNQVKTHLQDRALDHGTQSKMYVPKKDVAVKRNPARKGLSLSKKFSEMSVETGHLPEDIKVKKRTVWNNDLVIQTEPQVWKFNGTTLEPEKTDSRVTMSAKRTTVTEVKKETNIPHRERNAFRGLKKRNSAWNDNMDLLVEKKVNFGYISKETKNGNSTITACWGDVHQTRPLRPPKQNWKHVDKPRSPKKILQPKHEGDVKQCAVSGETDEPQNQPIVDKPKRRRSKNVKTTVIRHEIKVIHVNEKGESLSEKEASSRGLSLENFVPSSCQDRLFAFGTKAGLEDSQLFHCGLTVPKSKTKEHSLSDMEEISVCNDTPSKCSEKYFDHETSKGCCTALDDSKDQRRLSFLSFGRKISDIVAGSHVARSMLVALYEKWIPVRNNTIELLEKLAENVSCSRRRNKQIEKAVDLIQNGSKIAGAVPNIKVTIVARIIAAITPFISMLFRSSPNITQTGVTETEMMNQIQDDIEATLEVYMFGTQCDHQFREVCELFEEFQAFIDASDFSDFTGPEAEFVSDISFFNPKNLVVYYRRLYKAFLNLHDNRTSGVTRAFCRGLFEDNPQAIETVKLLHWRFPAQIEDSEAFQRAWKEVSRVLDSSDSSTEVLEDIRDCINILRKERRTIENCMAELRENID